MSEPLHLPDALGHKIGPLPVAGWAAAVIGGLGIAWYMRGRGGASSTAAPATDGADPLVPVTPGTGGAALSDPSYAGSVSAPTDAETAGNAAAPITSNGQWRQQAVKWLVGAATPAVTAEQAVGQYLSGKPLSPGQVALINRVIAAIGPTPQAVPPIVISPAKTPTTPAPVPTPAGHHYATNKLWADAARSWIEHHGSSSLAARTIVYDYFQRRRPMPRVYADQMQRCVNAIGLPPVGHWQILRETTPIRHKQEPTAQHHDKRTAHPNARRDVGANTNPGR